MKEKIALKLIGVPDWATSALIWGVGERHKNGNLFWITGITNDAKSVEAYRHAIYKLHPAVLYFCDGCGAPLETLFCDCLRCGLKYGRGIAGEATFRFPVLDRGLPQYVVAVHNAEVFGDVRNNRRCEWIASDDSAMRPMVRLPRD